MTNISIFAKRAFLNTAPNTEFVSKEHSYKGNGHLQRVSSIIRADQIATQIGAKLNPREGFEEDVCIYVKPHVKPHELETFKFEGKRSYVDIIDGWGLIPLLERHPEVGVIACSEQDTEKLRSILPNKVVFIPQHHVNFERIKRDLRKPIKTIGVIGTKQAFKLIPNEIREGLEKRGLTLKEYSNFFTRQDIVDFYKSIDIQLVWRPYRMRLSNPLKIVNAASFGIPTIAYEESVFNEIMDCYTGVKNIDNFFICLDEYILNNILYANVSKNCIKGSEKYHISEISKLYQEL